MADHTQIEILPETVLPVLRTLLGRNRGVKVGELVEMITGEESTPGAERHLREVMVALRMAGMPACATPEDGYFWGITADEVWETVQHLTRRSMTGLTQASRMTKQSIPELVGQLALEIEGEKI